VDNDYRFYNIAGGTQDNSTQYGPSRTNNNSGIRNSDWRILIGGDGHDCAIDPEDPNIIYCEAQEGYLRRYDRGTGESIDIRPQPALGEDSLRFNWDSPILISPHKHTRVYYGSKKLHRSDDRGDSWTAISPDLSRQRDRLKLPVMGRVWSIDAIWDLLAMSEYGNITSIDESPLKEGLIYVGTDDGLIQVTEDGGRNWRKIESIDGVPEFAFINDIKADLHDVDTVYAVLDHHKTGDYRPFVMKSTDRGQTWSPMTGDLPDRHIVWRIVQDHVDPDLFFLGTEFGLFFTVDGGRIWVKLKGDVPTIPFRDLEIQKRENDLVGATFGRGFFVLDDYSSLRGLSNELLENSEFLLFPARKAPLYVPARALGREKGTQGDAFYTASNPPLGAVLTYYLRDELKTKRKLRHEKEAEVKKTGGNNVYPGFDAIKTEEREEEPEIVFTISNDQGQVVRRIKGETAAGFHRLAWDLRHAPPTSDEDSRGPLVTPGTYTVKAARRVADQSTPLGEARTFEVVAVGNPSLPPQNRREVEQFQLQAGKLLNEATGIVGRLRETLDQLKAAKAAIRAAALPNSDLLDETRRLELKLLDAQDVLTGNKTKTKRQHPTTPSILQRAENALDGSLNSTYGPTKTHREEFEIAQRQMKSLMPELRKMLEDDLPQLQKKLSRAGVPWTSGRPIPGPRQ